jgi:hypothetical protein
VSAFLILIRSATTQIGIAWDGNPVTLGRGLENGIVLSHRGISGRHLHLERTPDGAGVLATDLGSRNGTRLLGTLLEEPTLLLPGGSLDLAGEVVLRVLRAADAASQPATTVTPTRTGSLASGVEWRVVVEGAAARPAVRVLSVRGGEHCGFRPSHGSTLLAVLAERNRVAFPGPGWVLDDDLRVALWGKAGLLADPNNLNVVIYRIRQRLQAAGLPGSLLEKETNRVRLVGCDVTYRRTEATTDRQDRS